MTAAGKVIRGTVVALEATGLAPRRWIRGFREAVMRPYAAERDRLEERVRLLEGLLTRGSASARPPGAMRAVAQLGTPAVAVIMPTFNRPLFVGEAIASVQRQTFANWQLVVVDDGGSADNAAAIAPFLADARIRYVTQPKTGSGAARNRGIAETTAPLITYLDDDNLWYPDFLACAVDILATEPDVDVAYGALVSAHHRLPGTEVLFRAFDRSALLQANFIDTSVMIHRRGLVSRFGGWAPDADLPMLKDWELVLRYTQEKPARPIEVLAAFYRDCDGRRMSTLTGHDEAYAAVRARWSTQSPLPGAAGGELAAPALDGMSAGRNPDPAVR
jgi:hypothetical protein